MFSRASEPNRRVLPVTRLLPACRTFTLSGIRLITVGMFLLSVVSFSCNESLPVYEKPKPPFAGSIEPEFRWIMRLQSELWIHVYLRNTFDETLEDIENLTGTLEIILLRDPGCRRTVPLNIRHIVPSGGVTLANGKVTVDPGDTLKLLYRWNFVDDNGNFLPLDVFHQHSEPGFPDVRVSDPETFLLRGSFQVFRRTGQTTFGPMEHVLTYYY